MEINNGVEIMNTSEYLDAVSNENMVDIYMDIQCGGVTPYLMYGFDGESWYTLTERYWRPIYVKDFESFLNYIKENSVFYHGSSLVKLK